MYPVHDVDAILLISLSLASKRRPAELVEIIAAIELMQDALPSETKLSDAFYRLSEYGLIFALEDRYALSPDAISMLTTHARKAIPAKRIYDIKEHLADYHLTGEHPIILLSTEQIAAAISQHGKAKSGTVKNLLAPKPKPTVDNRPGQRTPYKSFATRRRKEG